MLQMESENDTSAKVALAAGPRKDWFLGSGTFLVVALLFFSGLLSQVVSNALSAGALTRPTVSEAVIRNFWLGHTVLLAPAHYPKIQEIDTEGSATPLPTPEGVAKGNVVSILNEPNKPASAGADVDSFVPHGAPSPDLSIEGSSVSERLPAADPPSSTLDHSFSKDAAPSPPPITNEKSPNSNSSVSHKGPSEETGARLENKEGKSAKKGPVKRNRRPKRDRKKVPSLPKSLFSSNNTATQGSNATAQPHMGPDPSPLATSPLPPTVTVGPTLIETSGMPPSLPSPEGVGEEEDIAIFGDWEQPIPWTSPYVTAGSIDMANEPLCKGVVSVHPPPQNASAPLVTSDDLFLRRVFIILPRFGLGNAMRGYLSSVILALLSGRQMVLFHGGPHGQVFDKLCSAFRCGFDSISSEHGNTTPNRMWKRLEHRKGVFSFNPGHPGNITALFETLHSDLPVVATRCHVFFDKLWFHDVKRRECVFAATKCADIYCVQSRMARLFLAQGPTDKVVEAIKKHLRSKAPLSSSRLNVTAHIDKNVFFDISIHTRTNTMRVEGMDSNCKTKECVEKHIAKIDQAFQDENYWGCIDLLFRTKLAAMLVESDYNRVTSQGWRIFLAIDDVTLRPFFLKKLSTYGRVFYMAADISHFGRGPTSGKDPMPTLADLFFLGRAHIMLEGKERVSSFGQFSSLMSNASFATLNRRNNRCGLFVKHKGVIVHSL